MLFLVFCLLGAPATEHETSFVVYPADCNHNGTLFGGKIMAEMDRCAGVATRRWLYGSNAKDAVTISADGISFRKTGKVKDMIFVRAKIIDVGKKTVTLGVNVERETSDGEREILAIGTFVFCAVDLVTGKAIEHGRK
jgi:acyl-CoA thioesterase YciA